jgi:hypothetical protein
MNTPNPSLSLLVALALAMVMTSPGAQPAPGEDPVQLIQRLEQLSLPGPLAPKSGNLDGRLDMPAWMKARIARYEARAFSAFADGTLLSDNDVVTSASAQGLRKTCVQEVGSVSSNDGALNRYGPGNQQQVVVLRGDLVNICR